MINNIVARNTQLAPLKFSILYLLSTFILFLMSNMVNEVDNLLLLTMFIAAAYAALSFGYIFGLRGERSRRIRSPHPTKSQVKFVNQFAVVGSIYFFLWGINQINDFGGNDIGAVIDRITNPGSAYSAKFDVYEERIANGAVNRVTQILILASVVYAIFLPVLIVYWGKIRGWVRKFSIFSVAVYIVSFLYIGTQKGLGDVILMSGAGFAIVFGGGSVILTKLEKRRIVMAVSAVVLCGFGYMAANQSSRAAEFGITSSMMAGDVSQTWLAKNFGENLALGAYVALGYPSHGYLGLSYNLKSEFEFSYGAGLSQAIESYRYQFFGGEPNFTHTYPARTEILTGWPAGMYWATAFPWFASDLTFLGTIALMFFLGYVFARVWLRCLSRRDVLAFGALGQIFVFIAFLPANNQVLMQRQGLWAVSSLLVLAFMRRLGRPKF